MFKNRSFLVKMVNDKNAPEGEPVEEEIDIDAIRGHFQKYKYAYLSGAVAGITLLIMKGSRYEALANGGAYGPKTADTLVTMRPLSFLSKQDNVVKVVNRVNHGRPGYLVHSLDTNEFFPSQREAAGIFGISEKLLSNHLNGKIPNAEGYRFERLNFAE